MKKWVALAIVFVLLCVTINVGVLNHQMNKLSLLVDQDAYAMVNRTNMLAYAHNQVNSRVDELNSRTDPNAVPNMIELVLPSVVKIIVGCPNPFDPNSGAMLTSSGSGVVINSERGLILTCAHVVENLTEPNSLGFVLFADGSSGKIVGLAIDPNGADAALVQVDRCPPIAAAVFADYTKIRPGQTVFVIGNPYSFRNSVTAGVVSKIGFGRYDFPTIQVDVDINPGNSGGPVFNANGEIVGLAMAAFGPGFSIGLNGIISVEAIMNALPDMLEMVD